MDEVIIKFPRFESQFGRSIAYGQLHYASEGKAGIIMSGSFAQIMFVINENGFKLVNAQEMLNLLIQTGFAV